MPSFSTTSNSTKSVSVSCAAAEVARIEVTVPAKATVVFYSTSSTDTYGYLSDRSTSSFTSSGAPTPSGSSVNLSNDDGNGNTQWKISYTNSSTSSITLYIYHRCYSIGNTCSSIIYGECDIILWHLGNTYTMPAFPTHLGPNDTSIQNSTINVSCGQYEVVRITINILPYTKVKMYSSTTNNIDTYGYLAEPSTITGAFTSDGHPLTSSIVSDDNSAGNGQWRIIYDNTSDTQK